MRMKGKNMKFIYNKINRKLGMKNKPLKYATFFIYMCVICYMSVYVCVHNM